MFLTRVATAAVALPLAVFGILFLPTSVMALVLAALMLMGAWEWGGLAGLAWPGRGLFVGVVACVMALSGLSRTAMLPLGTDNLVIALACLWWLLAVYWVVRYPAGWTESLGRREPALIVGVVALVAPVVAMAYLHQSDDGPLLVLTFFILVWAADTAAYLAGHAMGRHKLAPRISPGKTREGAAGGVAAAVALSALCSEFLGYGGVRMLAFMVLGAWVALISIVGDLTISMFKRHAHCKDSGTLFPGHGGVLDRLDSFVAAAPWFVAGLHWLPSQF